MGADSSKIDRRTFAYVQESKVRLYSKDNFKGNTYEIDYGNYTSAMFIKLISPDNVFSLTVPPNTSIAMFCGDMYDYGGKGSVHIINVTNERADVPMLPLHIQGNVRSLSITKTINNSMGQVNQTSSVKDMSTIPNDFSGLDANFEYFTQSDPSQSKGKISCACIDPNTEIDNTCLIDNRWMWLFIMILIFIIFMLLVRDYNRSIE